MDHGVLAAGGKFAEGVLAATGGVDVVLELVGGAYVAEDLACISPRGRIALVGLMAGPHTDLDLGAVLRKRVTIFGTVLRARPIEEKIQAALLLRRLALLFAAGRLAPVLEGALPLDRASEAHAAMAKNATFGKLVLEP
jgi:NADPH:quinone reductase-like Zn-dependent oxidoreductase